MTTPTSTSGNTAPEGDGALIQSLLRALGAFRAVALTWAIVGLLFSRMYLTEPLAAAIVLAAMAGVTALVTPFRVARRYWPLIVFLRCCSSYWSVSPRWSPTASSTWTHAHSHCHGHGRLPQSCSQGFCMALVQDLEPP